MEFNTEIRRKQLESLDQFISSSKDKVQSILDALEWTEEKVIEGSNIVTCVINTSHKVPEKSYPEHYRKCTLRKEGYDLKETFLPEPKDIPGCSLRIDHAKKVEILSAAHKHLDNFKNGWNGKDPDPKTSDRLAATYSPDERAALYDYVAKHTKGPKKLPEFNISQPRSVENRELTEEELRLQERNAKRRRMKYKSVHTNKKSHTEILREVIDSQMELYKEWLEKEEDCDKADDKGNKEEKYVKKKEIEDNERSPYTYSGTKNRRYSEDDRNNHRYIDYYEKHEHQHSSKYSKKHDYYESHKHDYHKSYHKKY